VSALWAQGGNVVTFEAVAAALGTDTDVVTRLNTGVQTFNATVAPVAGLSTSTILEHLATAPWAQGQPARVGVVRLAGTCAVARAAADSSAGCVLSPQQLT
jgi:hypothetical protein